MYFNDVHILIYVAIAVAGFFIGKFVNWCNYRLPEYKKVFSKEMFKAKELEGYKPNLLISLITMLIYIVLLYVLGIEKTFLGNLELIKYLILTPMLLSVFVIDLTTQTIPNRLNLTIFEIGLIIAFLSGWSNIAITINMILGMIAGGGIFLLITLISRIILGKEAIGLGDVKLIAALGLYFGLTNIAIISIISFILAAIISIILLIAKRKKPNESISFGPFIVIASIISILVPTNTILSILIKICTLGLYKK